MSSDASEFLYRYRPIKAALHEFHELENDHIYFSTTGELNDPLEGFRDLFWQGDDIVWRNLLKHFFLCALETLNYCLLSADQFDAKLVPNIIFKVPQELPDAPVREIYRRLSFAFLAEPASRAFVEIMAARTTPVRRNELTSYLRPLHALAMQHLITEYQQRGLFHPPTTGAPPPSSEQLNANTVRMMQQVPNIGPSEYPPERISEAVFGANEAMTRQMQLILEHNLPDREQKMPIMFFSGHFPTTYVAALEKLVHPEWYVACFSPRPDDVAMWNGYTGGHKGICLIFKPTKNSRGNPSLKLLTRNGMSGPDDFIYSEVEHEIEPVQYTREFPPIDFFGSFGVIPIPHIDGFWYRSDDGRFSECRKRMFSDEEAWRASYWDTIRRNALTKTPEWETEGESRIVFQTGFDARAVEHRRLKYRFEDLAGIVFGANTEFDDRLAIMKIVDQKCKGEHRKTFRFHEMRYLHTEGRFQLFDLGLLKLTT